MKLNKQLRKIHYWISPFIFIPILLILSTGILLQLKKQSDWIQPPIQQGVSNIPSIEFQQMLEAAKSVPEAEINSWDDIDRLDVRISKGIVKVRSNNRWEIQIDTYSGKVIQVAYRRSDIIEQIHDGSWFHDKAKLWIFLPSGIILFVLWITGFYMFLLPYIIKGRKNKKF